MNLLDENIPFDQRDLLRAWNVYCRVVGHDIAQLSASDENLIVTLHRLKQPTFFTRDRDFFKGDFRHAGYCLVWLDLKPAESGGFCDTRPFAPKRNAWDSSPESITMAFRFGGIGVKNSRIFSGTQRCDFPL